MEDTYCSCTEAAQILHVSTASVRRLMAEGKLQGFRTPTAGKHRRISRASLEQLRREMFPETPTPH